MQRLDKLVFEKVGNISRTKAQSLISDGFVTVDGKAITKPSFQVAEDSKIKIDKTILKEEPFQAIAYEMPLEILFEDSEVIVVNKPAGLTTHPGSGNLDKTLVNALVSHFKNKGKIPTIFKQNLRGGVVHRLDKDTTGVMVVAKTEAARLTLVRQFSERTMERRYLALVLSSPRRLRGLDKADSGTIDTLIGRDAIHRVKMAVVESGGREAITTWKIKERMNWGALVNFQLKTGRTHQIRVHCAHQKSPIIGDKTYGDFTSLPKPLLRAAEDFGRQALHAEMLSFSHPKTGEKLSFSVKPPEDFSKIVNVFRAAV